MQIKEAMFIRKKCKAEYQNVSAIYFCVQLRHTAAPQNATQYQDVLSRPPSCLNESVVKNAFI